MLMRGVSCGHDFNYHLLSWMEVARAWQHGLAYPRWIQDANYGAGEPRLIFYPPASWLLGAALGSIGSGIATGAASAAALWTAAPVLFVLLALSAGGACMYLLARQWVSAECAVFAACLYTVNPYALFVVYERSAYGELLAASALPLVVLFALRRSPSIAGLGLAMAAIWLSDLPAAVLASYMLAFLALAMALLERKAWPVLRAAGGMALGLGLSAFYIVPAAYEQAWVQISLAVTPGARVQDGFLFEHTGDILHDQVLRTASWIFAGEIAVAALAAGLALRQPSRSRARIALLALLPVILFLQFPVSMPVWRAAPELAFLQFPWRWTLVAAVAACFFLGMALGGGGTAQPARAAWTRRAGVVLAVLALIAGGERIFFQVCDDEDAVSARWAAFQAGPPAAGVEGSGTYTTRGANGDDIQQALPLVRVLQSAQGDEVGDEGKGDDTDTPNPKWVPNSAVAVKAKVTVTERNVEQWKIRIEGAPGGYAVLRLMDYPAWQVTLNGKAAGDRPQRPDGLMTIPLPAGSNNTPNMIEVRWKTTGDVIAGDAISLLSLLLLLPLAMGERRRAQLVREQP